MNDVFWPLELTGLSCRHGDHSQRAILRTQNCRAFWISPRWTLIVIFSPKRIFTGILGTMHCPKRILPIHPYLHVEFHPTLNPGSSSLERPIEMITVTLNFWSVIHFVVLRSGMNQIRKIFVLGKSSISTLKFAKLMRCRYPMSQIHFLHFSGMIAK